MFTITFMYALELKNQDTQAALWLISISAKSRPDALLYQESTSACIKDGHSVSVIKPAASTASPKGFGSRDLVGC